jgi:hypothetical protein
VRGIPLRIVEAESARRRQREDELQQIRRNFKRINTHNNKLITLSILSWLRRFLGLAPAKVNSYKETKEDMKRTM